MTFEYSKNKLEFTLMDWVLTYQDGCGFGELALMEKNALNAKRKATIVCDEECFVAILSKNAYIKTLMAS